MGSKREGSLNIQIETFDGGREVRVIPLGDLRVGTTPELYASFDRVLKGRELQKVGVDFAHVSSLDSSGIATLSIMVKRCHERGVRVQAINLSDDFRDVLGWMPRAAEGTRSMPPRMNPFEALGDYGLDGLSQVSEFYDTVADTAFALLRVLKGRFPPKGAVSTQAVRIGVDALPIIALLSLLLGLVLAFQAAEQLEAFGADIYTADIVGIGMLREFGPILTGIVLAGRSGSSIAAELGTMQVNEEIDALYTMAIDPYRFLVVPRIIGITIVQPALTLMSDLIGVTGGLLIGMLYLGIPATAYVNESLLAIELADLLQGLAKSIVFALLIGSIGCYAGLSVSGGAAGVGRATTRAVVASIFMIIVADSIFTTLSTLIG